MDVQQKVLFVDAATGYYRVAKYPVGEFFGPVDLGLHLSGRFNSLNIGVGLFAGSILPGSNRLIVTGFSPCWGGFFVSSMGGAGLVFDNLGINMLSLVGRAPAASILVLNREHGEEVDVSLEPVDLSRVWADGRGGFYSLLDHVHARFAGRYSQPPRILAVGPAARATDFGAIGSVPIDSSGKLTHVDTWAGRGGFGSRLLAEHNIAAVIYGGTVVDEDFRDRKVADDWFQVRYQKRLAAKDFEATTKYRFDPKLATGGTLGVNFARLGGEMLSFNYRSIYMTEAERVALHRTLVVDHYLKQFNDETIATKQQHTCGEPCAAVCKKMRAEFKKDYEPYETMGPQCGIFDQRAAETLAHHADRLGFDAISVGGVLSWIFECLHEKVLAPGEVGADAVPVFTPDGFRAVEDSAHNARLGVAVLDAIVAHKFDLSQGARRRARHLARAKGRQVMDLFVHIAFARKGWMVPNQYLDARRPGADAHHGQVLHVLRSRLPPPAAARPPERRAVRPGAAHGQPGHLPLPPRLGRGDGARDRRGRLREGPAVRREGEDDREPHQQPQRLGLLGAGPQRRPRARLPGPAARGGGGPPGPRRLDCPLRVEPPRGRPRLLVRDAQGHPRVAAGVPSRTQIPGFVCDSGWRPPVELGLGPGFGFDRIQ